MAKAGHPKYDAGLQEGQEDFLCLHRNENLFVGTDWTVDRAQEIAGRIAIQRYPDHSCSALREALARHYDVTPENVFVGNGSDEVLAVLLSHFRERFDKMHVLDVCFLVYRMLATRYGYETVTLPGDTFTTGRVTADPFRGFAVVDSPNAITGVHIPDDDLAPLGADPDSVLIWDNVYGEYSGDEVRTPLRPNTVIVRSFSKFYGLAALRIGYCLADAPVIAALNERKDVFNVNGFAQAMALDALARYDEFEAHCQEMLRCRETLTRHLEARGFETQPPGGHFVLAKHAGYTGDSLHAALFERGVAVRLFPGGLTDPYIRITVPPQEGIEAFVQVLDDLLATEPQKEHAGD